MQLLMISLLPMVIGSDIASNNIDKIITKLLECRKETASLGVSVVHNGKLILNKAYGKADIEADIDATVKTRFSIGSVTKIFTAYLAGLHVNKGNFAWDDKLVDIFKKHGLKFSLQGKFRSSEATVKDALAHRTCIKAYDILLNDGRNLSREDWMLNIVPLLEQARPFRDAFYYNNWMYTLVGYIMELEGKLSYEDQVKKEIFEKIGMDETFFVSDSEMDTLKEGKIAIPYSEDSKQRLHRIPLSALKLIGPHNPAGGMMSTTTDMANFITAVQNAMQGNTSPLNASIIEEITDPKMMVVDDYGPTHDLFKPQFKVSFTQKGYGAGTFTGFYRGFPIFFHGGSSHGHYSYLTFLPAKGIGIFTAMSGNDFQSSDCFIIQQAIWMAAVDQLLGEEPWLTEDYVCDFPSPLNSTKLAFPGKYTEKKGPINNSQQFVGIWKRPEFPDVIVNGTDNNIYFEMGGYNGTIYPVEEDELTLCVVVSQPIDPIEWPESEKGRAYMIFSKKKEKIEEMKLVMFMESYVFTRSPALAMSQILLPLVILLLCLV